MVNLHIHEDGRGLAHAGHHVSFYKCDTKFAVISRDSAFLSDFIQCWTSTCLIWVTLPRLRSNKFSKLTWRIPSCPSIMTVVRIHIFWNWNYAFHLL